MVQQKASAHPTPKRLFEGRKIVVPSMHGKHHVMKPLLRQYLNLDTVIIPESNSDEFGAFSRDIERPLDPVTTLRKKILKTLQASGETLAIGNEGSFSPHRFLPMVQTNQEFVMLIDLENDLEIIENVVSTDTVHAQKEITCLKDMLDFTAKIRFPSHGVILRQIKSGKIVNMRKGILTWELLYSLHLQYSAADTQLIAETDMRGYMNPTRMKVIERATESLMKKIISLCPECHWPGFGVVEVKNGLGCRHCSEPTNLTLLKIYQCKNCGYSDERYYDDGQKADPKHCDHCKT